MITRNFLEAALQPTSPHDGEGTANSAQLFTAADFDTPANFVIYTVLQPLSSIGYHTHGADEELYIVLEGQGIMQVNGQSRTVHAGDIILNKPGWSHGLRNESTDHPLRLLVISVGRPAASDLP